MAEDRTTGGSVAPREEGAWMRLLWSILLLILLRVAEIVLAVSALLQVGWLLFAGGRNLRIAGFGRSLAEWMREAAAYLSGAEDAKPFPWRAWPGTGADEG